MALGWLFAWTWLPALQNPRDGHSGIRLPSKTLEQLGEGIAAAREAGEAIGLRACLAGRGEALYEKIWSDERGIFKFWRRRQSRT